MNESEMGNETEPEEAFQVDPFPALWVLLLGSFSLILSLVGWGLYLIQSPKLPPPGVEVSAGALFLGFIVLGMSKGNTLRERFLVFAGTTLSLFYFLVLLSHFLVALLLILTGNVPELPSPG